ncbi:hypothetical protein HNV10_05110 [Winogradskyella litoriviva]|uniref:DUF6799 domain-containing protein n=1 Tax=Winogradskyella litoriviva TaxID=1220182 RepID=A0ABX2E2B2_9FLAO|nr:DUF6799 domain-containing protein [Winogradskyella litoriviva]NRD22608.1 hypothetical protein [Winogradskyella litoriviva]
MKKIVLTIAFVVLGATAIIAQERDQDRIQDQDRTKLVMVNGEMLEVRERAHLRLQNDVTLNDGTVVSVDGTYLTKDKDRLRLKDGQCLDNDGIMYRNEYQYRYKIQQESKGLNEAQVQERNQNRVHYMLVDGEMVQIRNQSQNRLQQKLNLDNGTTVNPDGSYQTREGKKLQLREGECLNMEGEMFKNTYQHRKMVNKKTTMKKKVQKKPKIQKKINKKGTK